MPRLAALAIAASLAATAPAAAEPEVADPVVALIEHQGYTVSEISRTWLGRILITAKNGTYLREIALNRATGQILRDRPFPLVSPKDPGASGSRATEDVGNDLVKSLDDATDAADGVTGTVGVEGTGGISGDVSGKSRRFSLLVEDARL